MFSMKKAAGVSAAVALVLTGAFSVAPADARAKAQPKTLTIWADGQRAPNLIKAIGTLAE